MNPLIAMPWVRPAVNLLFLLLAFWAGYEWRDRSADAELADIRATAAKAYAAEQAKARAREQQITAQTEEAANAYRKKLSAAARDAAGARTERDRLLDAVAAAPACGPAPGASAAAGADGTTVLRAVLGSCATALQSLAEGADADASRLSGLQGYVTATRPASAP